MTDEVAVLVLRNNYLQTLALSLSQRRGMEDFGFLQRLMQTLEARGLLDRAVEFLADDMQLAERRRRSQPFTRPELSVLLAYAKLTLYDDLLEFAVPDDRYLARELGPLLPARRSPRGFPMRSSITGCAAKSSRPSSRNSMINRGGPSLIVRIADQTGAAPAAIAAAFAAVRDSYGMTALNAAIDGLDNRIAGKMQLDLYAAVQDLLLDRIIWFLRNVDLTKGLAGVVAHYRDGIAAVAAALDNALSGEAQAARGARRQELVQRACPTNWPAEWPISARSRPRPTSFWSPTAPARASAKSPPPDFATGAFFRLDRIARRGEQHPDRRLFRPAGARPGAGFHRRRRAALDRRDGRQRRGRRRRGRSLGGAAQGRSRTYPRRDPRDRRFRPDAVEAYRRGKPARAIW